MATIGKTQSLMIKELVPIGAFLDGKALGEILLPTKELDSELEVGDYIDVFVYTDSDDRLIATTRRPKVELHQVANLKATSITNVGAFLDWGLPKELLVPFGQQKIRMEAKKHYPVFVYLDDATNRLVASSKLERFIKETDRNLKTGQKVQLTITDKTPLGFKAVINNQTWGLLFEDDAVDSISVGRKVTGFVKRIRKDGKIDVWLQPSSKQDPRVDALKDQILDHLAKNRGFSPLGDKGDANQIKKIFSTSKAKYKKAIGALYKERKIEIVPEGIRLNK